MIVASLGGSAGGLLVQHEGCNILLDLPALPALQSCTRQQQQQRLALRMTAAADCVVAALDELHAVLVTNPWGLLGLAHLQQLLRAQGRDLPIHTYCTEPCLHFFQQLSQELLSVQQCLQQQQQTVDTAQQHSLAAAAAAPVLRQMDVLHQQVPGSMPPQHNRQQQADTTALVSAAATPSAAAASDVQPLFAQQQLQSVLDAVQIVRFGQRVVLPGCFGVTAEARPSGSGIGSCLWLLSCGDQRYAYLSPASVWPGPSAPLHQPSLHNLDVLLLGTGCLTAAAQLQPPDMLSVALHAAAGAVARGGRVLVPVVAGEGAVLQLLEHLPAALAAAAGPAAPVPLVYVSPAAADALATANSCCEYLEQGRQQQVLERGEAPFTFEQLAKAGQLHILAATAAADSQTDAVAAASSAAAGHSSASEAMEVDTTAAAAAEAAAAGPGNTGSSAWEPVVQRVLGLGPCVVFVPLWSLAAGPGVLLSQAWCSSPHNLLLLPEPGPLTATWLQQCCDAQLMPPQQQWGWQVQYAPLTRPSAATAGGSSGVAPQGSLTAADLLRVLSNTGQAQASQQPPHCQVVASEEDVQLLQAAVQEEQRRSAAAPCLKFVPLPAPTACDSLAGPTAPEASASATNSSRQQQLMWHQLHLPAPLLQAALSTELADRLQLQRLRLTKQQLPQPDAGGAAAAQEVQEVPVARVQALLTHRSGSWRLDPLPAGPRPEAVSAVLARQQQPQQELLWGSVDATQLLADLQAAGFQAALISSMPQQPAAAAGAETPPQLHAATGTPTAAAVISVNDGAAQLRLLGAHETEVECDSAIMRHQLLQCLFQQLHRVA